MSYASKVDIKFTREDSLPRNQPDSGTQSARLNHSTSVSKLAIKLLPLKAQNKPGAK